MLVREGGALTTGLGVVVLGGGGGVGACVLRQLASRGHRVVAVGRRKDSLRRVTAPLRELGYAATEFVLDVAEAGGDDGLASFTLNTFGRFDCIVNTAAVYRPSPVTALDERRWSETMDTNLRGPLLVTSSAARHFVQQGSGRIVHISSITALVSRGGYTLFEASKAGLVAATRSMAVELAPHGVVVNSVAPGWIRTPMTKEFVDRASSEAIAAVIPLGRVGEPEEIAAVTCWLAVDSPVFLTGQTIVVDGGQMSRTPHL